MACLGSYVLFIPFLVFGHFWQRSYKILHNLYLHFARQDGPERKRWKENHATKVTKKPKDERKYGMNETVHLSSFFPETSLKELNVPKLKSKLRAFCPDIYTVPFRVSQF